VFRHVVLEPTFRQLDGRNVEVIDDDDKIAPMGRELRNRFVDRVAGRRAWAHRPRLDALKLRLLLATATPLFVRKLALPARTLYLNEDWLGIAVLHIDVAGTLRYGSRLPLQNPKPVAPKKKACARLSPSAFGLASRKSPAKRLKHSLVEEER